MIRASFTPNLTDHPKPDPNRGKGEQILEASS
jgi:hypothetical protein